MSGAWRRCGSGSRCCGGKLVNALDLGTHEVSSGYGSAWTGLITKT